MSQAAAPRDKDRYYLVHGFEWQAGKHAWQWQDGGLSKEYAPDGVNVGSWELAKAKHRVAQRIRQADRRNKRLRDPVAAYEARVRYEQRTGRKRVCRDKSERYRRAVDFWARRELTFCEGCHAAPCMCKYL